MLQSMLVLWFYINVLKTVDSFCPFVNQPVYNGHIEQPQNAIAGDKANVICQHPYVISNKRNNNMTILKCQNDGTWDGEIPNCKPKTTENFVYSFKPRKNRSMTGTILKEFPVNLPTAAGECGAKCWQDIRCLLYNLIFANNSKDAICQMLDIPFGKIVPNLTTSFYDFYDPGFCATYLADEFIIPNNTHWKFANDSAHLASNGSTVMLGCDGGFSKLKPTAPMLITCSLGSWIADQNITMRCVEVEHTVGQLLLIGSEIFPGNEDTMEIYDVNQPENNRLLNITLNGTRGGHVGGVFDDGTVVIAGGLKDGQFSSDTELYYPKTNHIIPGPPLNEKRYSSAATMFNNQLIVCGGYIGKDLATCEKLVQTNNSFEWEFFASLNQARLSHALVQSNNTLYVIGGSNGSKLSSIERYNPTMNIWTFVAPMNKARDGHAAAVLNGFIYVCGGYDQSHLNSEKECELYDPENDQWSTISSMNVGAVGFNLIPIEGGLYALSGEVVQSYNVEQDRWTISEPLKKERHASAAVILKHVKLTSPHVGQILLIGSYGRNTMEIYDVNQPENNRFVDVNLTTALYGHVSGVFDDGTVAIAAAYKNGGGSLTDTDFYYPQFNGMVPGPNMTTPRRYPAAAMLDNEMIVCGGSKAEMYLTSCEKLFFSNSSRQFEWKSFPSINRQRNNHAMVQLNNTLFAIGGYDYGFLKSVEQYNSETNSWSDKKSMNRARAAHCAAVLIGFIYVCGGTPVTKECEQYNPASDEWKSVASMYAGHEYFGLISLEDKLYAFSNKDDKRVEMYNPENNTWSSMPQPMIAQRNNFATILIK